MLGILQVLKKERKKKVHYISCGLAEPGHTKQNKGKRVMPYQALPGFHWYPTDTAFPVVQCSQAFSRKMGLGQGIIYLSSQNGSRREAGLAGSKLENDFFP